MTTLQPGMRLGPYEIQSAIGAGGMGEVYKARDVRLNRIVAIKALPVHLADQPDLLERFEREARAVSSLNHPHICAGGVFPRWRRDGREIFYFSTSSLGKVMAVPVNASGLTFEAGTPRELFVSGYVNLTHSGGNWHTYAVSPDGLRFLIPRPASNLQGETAAAPITVILNWTGLLKE